MFRHTRIREHITILKNEMRILDLKNNIKIEDLYMTSQVQREYIIQNCDISGQEVG